MTTSYGNEGIRAIPGEDIMIADAPEEFARAMVSMLLDHPLRGVVGERGRLHVERRFSAEGMKEALDVTYRELVGPR